MFKKHTHLDCGQARRAADDVGVKKSTVNFKKNTYVKKKSVAMKDSGILRY
jgi:hypothetical protein